MTDPTDTPPPAAGRRPRRRWLLPAAVVLAGVAAFGLFWFQPWKVFVDERIDDAVPTVTTAADTAEPDPAGSDETVAPEPPSTEPLVLRQGQLVSIDKSTSGTVRVLELSDGSRFVRLEDLDTSNGPDLFLYLTTNPAGGDEGAFDDDVVNLGRLQGNLGNQNYELPADVDLDRYGTVVIWCDRFSSAFGAADLDA